MTTESFNALEHLYTIFGDYRSAQYRCSEIKPALKKIWNFPDDGIEFIGAAYAEHIHSSHKDRIDAAARKFVETWLKYDGEKNLVEAAT